MKEKGGSGGVKAVKSQERHTKEEEKKQAAEFRLNAS